MLERKPGWAGMRLSLTASAVRSTGRYLQTTCRVERSATVTTTASYSPQQSEFLSGARGTANSQPPRTARSMASSSQIVLLKLLGKFFRRSVQERSHCFYGRNATANPQVLLPGS